MDAALVQPGTIPTEAGFHNVGGRRSWHTPTGEPCPRAVDIDGRIVGVADCHGCGFCLLLAGLVEATSSP